MTTLTLRTHITRVARKEINPTLHRAGLPTLGACVTLAEYRATLTKAQKVTLAGLMGAPVKAESTGFVKAKIRAHAAAKVALAELSGLHADCTDAWHCADCDREINPLAWTA